MAKRRGPYTHRVKCAEPSCKEWAFFEYTRLDEYAQTERSTRGWRCTRHTRPDEVLSLTNRRREMVVTVRPIEGLSTPVLSFEEIRNGFMYGPGFRAFAEDFPEGTRIRVTVEVEPADATVVRDAIASSHCHGSAAP